MFSLRRLAVSASRARPTASALSPSTLSINRHSRPKNLSELRKFESLLQLRWNSTYDSDPSSAIQGEGEGEDGDESGNHPRIRQVNPRPRRGPMGHPTEPTKVIYVGNLKYETTEKEIEEKFEEFGTIIGVRIPRTTETGIARGFAYVEFGEISHAAEAIEACHQAPFGGRRLNCQYVHRTDFRIRANPESTTLFIGNMSFNTTDDDLAELFKDLTGCVDVRVAIDNRTGQRRGFVHADFQDVQSAAMAKEKLTGVQLYGRRIRVDFSTPPAERKQQGAEMNAQRQRNLAYEDLMSKQGKEKSEGTNTTDETAAPMQTPEISEEGHAAKENESN